MKQVDKISVAELKEIAEMMYGDLVKADVDVERKVVIVDMEMHADGEAELLQSGSAQADLWGVNLYPAKFGTDDFVEFDSMINLKPHQNNMTRGVEDAKIQEKIRAIISGVVHE
ncbi:MAG TPA: DUF5674 family protein [Candidatus Saccharimonadales bacterium]|jgi:hypothetical protein